MPLAKWAISHKADSTRTGQWAVVPKYLLKPFIFQLQQNLKQKIHLYGGDLIPIIIIIIIMIMIHLVAQYLRYKT